jgi:CheY-like chemotaxis protein
VTKHDDVVPARPVLVVDDADDLRDMLVQFLRLEGFAPMPARHGGEALALLRQADVLPDAILLDLMMPVMDGRELRKQLRGDPRLKHVPVIVLSAVAHQYAEPDTVAILEKPLDFDVLLGALRRCRQGQQQAQFPLPGDPSDHGQRPH